MKKTKSKKTIVITACLIFFAAIVCLLCFLVLSSMKLPYSAISVSGTAVDNDQNNYICGGDLIRIDDKLYFNYKNSTSKYGIIEISENGSKRIYWEGLQWLYLNYSVKSLRNKDGMLLADVKDEVQAYQFETEKFQTDNICKSVPNFSLNYQESTERIFYIAYSEYRTEGSIWLYENGESRLIIDGIISCFYVKNDTVYYFDDSTLKEYDVKSGSIKDVFESNEYYIYSFIAEGDYIVFEGCKGEHSLGVYKIDLKKQDRNPELICLGNVIRNGSVYSISSFNVYNGYVYVTTYDKGVERYDLITNEKIMLCEKNVESCYILDDKWVYLVDGEYNLYRVTQDGKELEKVFG